MLLRAISIAPEPLSNGWWRNWDWWTRSIKLKPWRLRLKTNDGVYLVPAFTGLGAPWWKPDAKAAIWGMTLNAGKAHVLRAGLESIAYQVKDLIDMMTRQAGIELKALRVDGGPTKNQFLMQFSG